jgi:signal transduction histidine kinase
MKFPIRIRLALASCTVFVLVIATLEALAYTSVRMAIHSIVDHELETRLAGLDDHLARHIPHVPWPQLRESLKLHPAFQPELLRIQVTGGELLFACDALRDNRLPKPTPAASFTTTAAGPRSLRLLSIRRKIDGVSYDLYLATDLLFAAGILGHLWQLMGLSVPLVLLVSGGAGYWISGRAIAPVSGLIAAAKAIDSNRLADRIAVPETGDEIQCLAETMNGMLERIDRGLRQIRQFTANASHELRTPLAIIRANAEVALLDDGDRSGRSARTALRCILKETERESVLLDEMLQLARAAGVPRKPGRPVDLRESLRAACTDIRPIAELRGLRLLVTTPAGSIAGSIVADADDEALRRLWLILLDNAVKYTPEGGTISASTGTRPDGRPVVTVSDTGVGIAPEYRDKIFEPFFRIDKARSRSQGGAGLGLAIASSLVASHGALLEFESEVGRGSRFHVIFPPVAAAVLPRAGRFQPKLRFP